jgi:xanthine dehydrogenase accessory factor
MICGGDVYVHYHVAEPDGASVALFDAVEQATRRDEDSWLTLRIADGEATLLALYDGALRDFGSGIAESDIKSLLKRKTFLSGEEDSPVRWYTVPLAKAGHVYIFGCGHVGQEIVPVLTHVGFSCVVYDNRPEFAKEELFPAASRVVCGGYREIAKNVAIGPADYVIIVTPGHKDDYEVLNQTLRTEALYVGSIGSRRKIAILKDRLREAGVPEERILALRSPIGIEIKSETSEEIAVSIAAELILFRAEHAAV